MIKCCRGVIWKDSVAAYYLRGIERTLKLEKDLYEGKYKPGPVKHFRVLSPKPRDIASIGIRDRIYQRTLNDNAIYPIMARSFIRANCACQTGKGTDFARDYLKRFLRSYYLKYGTTGYVAQFDVHGYYPNMSHRVVKELLKGKLPADVYPHVERILDGQYDGDRGYNPGSQMIQIAGISLLNDLDHYIKERLHIRYYIRYMDDFILIHQDKAHLEKCYAAIENYLQNRLELELNPKKSRIYGLEDGIVFLGFTYRLTKTGKVLMQISSENVRRQRRKLKRLVHKVLRGNLPRKTVDEGFRTWCAHAGKGNSYKLLQRMKAYYKNLWKDGIANVKS
mgnify:CR=1 FL=1